MQWKRHQWNQWKHFQIIPWGHYLPISGLQCNKNVLKLQATWATFILKDNFCYYFHCVFGHFLAWKFKWDFFLEFQTECRNIGSKVAQARKYRAECLFSPWEKCPLYSSWVSITALASLVHKDDPRRVKPALGDTSPWGEKKYLGGTLFQWRMWLFPL